jgi:hypothetical protein
MLDEVPSKPASGSKKSFFDSSVYSCTFFLAWSLIKPFDERAQWLRLGAFALDSPWDAGRSPEQTCEWWQKKEAPLFFILACCARGHTTAFSRLLLVRSQEKERKA